MEHVACSIKHAKMKLPPSEESGVEDNFLFNLVWLEQSILFL